MDIDTSLVKQLIKSQFPEWSDLPVVPVVSGGWDNRSFRLGEDKLVRLPSADRYVPQVEKEQLWLPRLAQHLPLSIPQPLAKGHPGEGYSWPWSVYTWLPGVPALNEVNVNLSNFAETLAHFLIRLHAIDSSQGPAPGTHNFYRGGDLSVYDGETRAAIIEVGDLFDARAVLELWEDSLLSTWPHPPVWIHGDLFASNLLIDEGSLSAVIDFGNMAVGDPACDLAITWTFFSGESDRRFKTSLDMDGDTWARARGWTLWKSLITLVEHKHNPSLPLKNHLDLINRLLTDQKNHLI